MISAATVRVGTAGWANPPAITAVRPDGRSHLQHYADSFNCVEINSSFYRPHRRSTYERWRASTPARFAFSVKTPRTITHDGALRDCRAELLEFVAAIEGLGPKLGVVLVQLPPSLLFESRVVTAFFTLLRANCAAPVVCEPRNPSWFTGVADALLLRLGVGRVGADPARTPEAAVPAGDPRVRYWRLHGAPVIYYSAYSEAFLAAVAAAMSEAARDAGECWCIFDNTARHEAWPDAMRLGSRLSRG